MTVGQDVVSQFSTSVSNVGDTLQTPVAEAHVTFVDNLNNAGIWDKLLDVWTSLGGPKLTGGLVKLQHPQSTQSSMSNVGFSASNYSQKNGLKGGSNKYLKTGFIPRNFLNAENCHLSLFISDFSGSGSTRNYAGASDEFRIYSLSKTNTLASNLKRQMSLVNKIGSGIFVCASNFSSTEGYLKKNSDILVSETQLLSSSDVTNSELWLYQQNGATSSYGTSGVILTYTAGYGLTDDESTYLYEQIGLLNEVRSTL